MDQTNPEMFKHTFTSDMTFRDKFEKMKCFRIMDNDGNIITPGYVEKLPAEKLVKMHEAMLTMNEVDQVFNAAQRQSRISFYMT